MGLPPRLFAPVLAILGLPAAALAQTMIEYAAAAAVGTAGSAGGKVVSNSLDKGFQKIDQVIQKAAANPDRTRIPATESRKSSRASSAPAARDRGMVANERARGRKMRVTEIESLAQPAPASVASPAVQEPAPPSPTVTASAEEFHRLTPGATRQDLLERVGAPSFRVRIMGDGHVQEIYRYAAGGVDLGTVRVVDGAVTAIKPRNN